MTKIEKVLMLIIISCVLFLLSIIYHIVSSSIEDQEYLKSIHCIKAETIKGTANQVTLHSGIVGGKVMTGQSITLGTPDKIKYICDDNITIWR
jgi:hypothetical protein